MYPQLPNGVYAKLEAAGLRRVFAYTVLLALGALMIYLSFITLGGFGSRIALLVFGVVGLYMAEKLRTATAGLLMLTDAGIEDGDGRVLVKWDNMEGIERGAFALKPSNGFTVHTKCSMKRGWAPGLWWRVGKRFGVGGVSAAGAAKFMAEQIALRLAQKEQ